MAQQYVSTSGVVSIPGSYPEISVRSNNSGLSSTGVIMIVGEADAGPVYTSETDLDDNGYGPDQLSDVVAKYGSGPIVDAFRAAVAPSSDLAGSFTKIIPVKTNNSVKASGTLLNSASGTYGTLYAKRGGKDGNLILYGISSAAAEVAPTTGSFTYIPAVGTVNADVRLNGGAVLAVALSANTSPTSFVSTVNALAGVGATGGVDRSCITVSGTLALDANPGSAGTNVVEITRSVAWATTPSVGDTLVIATGGILAGAGSANVGAYVVTAATSTTVRATKLSDAGKGGATPGTITAPVDVVAASITAVTDLVAYSPVVISVDSGTVIDGVGKSLEIAELTTGTDLLSRCAYNLSTTVVTWVSKVSSPQIIGSGTEYKAQLDIVRSLDTINESLAAGGEIALKISYVGTTATFTIDKTAKTFSTTVVGGSGASISATALSAYPTISDFVTYINGLTGYSAAVGTATLGQLPLTALDSGTFNICSTHGAKNGRIKVDAYKFFAKASESQLVQLGDPATAVNSGLPAVKASTYFTGGTRGATTSAAVVAAIDALENVTGNFLVPLFSRDATSDITDSVTDSGSTYTIDAINLAAKSHVLKMSTLKRRGNRLTIVSKQDTFANQKEAGSNLASSRCTMAFLNFKQLDSQGVVTQFQPWMEAVIAAACQCAAFYRPIFHKALTTSGVVHAAGDFNLKSDTQVEEALLAGLLPARKSLSGGYVFVSDQTTYTKDANFVFNSIQAMYVADIIALSTAQRMEAAFVGQSVADVNASIALSFLEGIMADFLRLKLITASDDAPKGYKNVKVRLSGGNLIVELEVKLAGAIYFVPISFFVSAVSQTA